MKKSNILLFAVLLAFFCVITTANVYAAYPEPPAKALRTILTEAVTYPCDVNYSCYGDVEVTFIVAEDGAIQIKKLVTDNEDLGKYVKDALSKTCCKSVSAPYNHHYRVTFKFRSS